MRIVLCWILLSIHCVFSKTIPLDDCPLANIDIFLIAGRDTFPLLGFLLNSVSRFVPCSRRIHLLVDRGESLRRSKLWIAPTYGSHTIRLLPFSFPPDLPHIKGNKKGYILQAHVMLWADTYSLDSSVDKHFHFFTSAESLQELAKRPVDYVMFLDTDSIFALPTTCATLFDGMKRVLSPAWSIQRQPFYQPMCRSLTKMPCERSYMAFFPFVYPMRAFRLLRNHIQDTVAPGAKDFNHAFDSWATRFEWKTFSQFVVMGEVLREKLGTQAKQVYCKTMNLYAESDFGKAHNIEKDIQSSSNSSYYYYPAILQTERVLNTTDELYCLHHYIPPALHYGWPYQGYLGSNFVPEQEGDAWKNTVNFPDNIVDRRFTGKLSVNMTKLANKMLMHGHCLQLHLEALSIDSNGKPNHSQVDYTSSSSSSQNYSEVFGGVADLCRDLFLQHGHSISHLLDLYKPKRQLNTNFIRAMLTPYTSNNVYSAYIEKSHLPNEDSNRFCSVLNRNLPID